MFLTQNPGFQPLHSSKFKIDPLYLTINNILHISLNDLNVKILLTYQIVCIVCQIWLIGRVIEWF